jgi:hypothetical protein
MKGIENMEQEKTERTPLVLLSVAALNTDYLGQNYTFRIHFIPSTSTFFFCHDPILFIRYVALSRGYRRDLDW